LAKIYFQNDGELAHLSGRTISIIGYGNQGVAQAQNLRDSGLRVVVGGVRDASFERAQADGFEAYPVAEAVQRADIHILLLPDEVMPRIFDADVKPWLKPGQAIVISSGYNITYGFLNYPANVDVLMIAPRMIGTGVRSGYVSGKGFPSLIAVHQDVTGNAHNLLLALSRGVGTLLGGAVASSCDEETLCDLFNEHFGYVYALRRAYEILVEAGASPEAAMLEFWASGEEMELARVHFTHGIFHQLKLHSRTSQYGQIVTSRLSEADENAERRRLRQLIANIKDGTFARDWTLEQMAGEPVFRTVERQNLEHPMIAEEERLLRLLGVLERDVEPSSSAQEKKQA